MPSLFRKYLIGISVLLTSTLTAITLSNAASAVVDNTPDCDNVAIIRCGVFDAETLRRKAADGDVPKIFNHLGISQADLKGQFVDGIVWQDGRVTVGGKTVATGAITAGRNFGGTPIPGTTSVGTYSTSRFATEGQTAFVRMKADGTFDFAVVKACGNPVKATPKPAPEPPQPQQLQVCELASGKIISIKETEFNEARHTRDLNKCEKKPVQVCDLFSGKVITIDEKEFNEGKHTRDLSKCQPKVNGVTMVQVCDTTTKQLVTIKESDFDSSKHSRNLADCQTPAQPQVIAATGPEALATGFIGTGALGYGAYTFARSRRHLIGKHLGR